MMTLAKPAVWIVLAATLVGLPACSKLSASSDAVSPGAAPDDTAYAGRDYGGDGEMDQMAPQAESMSIAAPEEPRSGLFARRAERKDAKRISTDAARESSPSAPIPTSAEPGAQPDPGAQAEPAQEAAPETEDEARHIIYTAGMRIAVFNVQDALATAESLPERYGGYVQSMTDSQVVLRLPTKSLREVMSSLSGYGNVEQRWLRSQDVTAEFTDIESRLKALEKTHTQLLELLGKARTVEEALKVREALDRVSAELEVLKGRMRQLENMTTYSTLTLDFYERGPHTPTPSSNDPFPWVDSLGVENTEWK